MNPISKTSRVDEKDAKKNTVTASAAFHGTLKRAIISWAYF
jgi:hypothetical protein